MTDLHGPAGNVYDKFNTRNPLARWLMNGFKRSLFELIASLEVENVLEIGCGEGYVLELLGIPASVGLDVDHPILLEAQVRNPGAPAELEYHGRLSRSSASESGRLLCAWPLRGR